MIRFIHPTELRFANLCLMQLIFAGLKADIIAIDGKAICGSTVRKDLSKQIFILSAYDTQTQMTIASLEVGEKTNEIPGMLVFLQLFDVTGRIVTADSMHCQKAICGAVIEAGGDHVFQVKKNQRSLYESAQDAMDTDITHSGPELQVAVNTCHGHGREERHTCYMYPVAEWYEDVDEWTGLQCVAAVDRETTRKGEITTERAYYITSLLGTAAHLNTIVRGHWKIESMRWSLDVTFQEDACRITDRNTQLNFDYFIISKNFPTFGVQFTML